MANIMQGAPRRRHPDDIAIWSDGTWAHIEDVRKGDYHFMSDDYGVVSSEDVVGLASRGVNLDG